jgi:hypothetical protein
MFTVQHSGLRLSSYMVCDIPILFNRSRLTQRIGPSRVTVATLSRYLLEGAPNSAHPSQCCSDHIDHLPHHQRYSRWLHSCLLRIVSTHLLIQFFAHPYQYPILILITEPRFQLSGYTPHIYCQPCLLSSEGSRVALRRRAHGLWANGACLSTA